VPDKLYHYVGPDEIRRAVAGDPSGTSIRTATDLIAWATTQDEWCGDSLIATFVVSSDRTLRVAPRRSEHVACALGGSVLAAGELTVCLVPELEITEVTNQSTGYCPEPSCWEVVRSCLVALGIAGPEHLTKVYTFRRCVDCGERNLVKDGRLFCDLCEHELPAEWNFD